MKPLLLLLWCGALALAAPVQAQPEADYAFDDRVRALEKELRCPKCQNQTLADSPSDVAGAIRDEIRDMMRAGKDEEEIKAFLVGRYGDFVTYRPPFKPSTYVLWFGPPAFFLAAVGVLAVLVRRRSHAATRGLSEEERHRADAILGLDEDKS
jgi:cytochrome c-type biogenesis protein CcmH